MFSSDRNIENISQLVIEIKHFIELKIQSLQISFVSKMTHLLSALVVGMIVFMLFSIAAIFVSMMIAAAISPYVGGNAISYAIVVAFYTIIALIVYKKRHTWIESPIANFLGHLFFDDIESRKDEPQ